MSFRRLAAIPVIALATAVGLASCEGPRGSLVDGEAHATTTRARPVSPFGVCQLVLDERALLVRFAGFGATEFCSGWARRWSSPDVFWRKARDADLARDWQRTRCQLVSGAGHLTITVLEERHDDALAVGGRLCGQLAGRGWREAS